MKLILGTDLFASRRPVIDRNRRIFGYELLFNRVTEEGEAGPAKVEPVLKADNLGNVDIRTVAGDHPVFISLDPEALKQGLPEGFSRGSVIVRVSGRELNAEDEEKDEAAEGRAPDLCIDDPTNGTALPHHATFASLTINGTEREGLLKRVEELRKNRLKLIAGHVETREGFDDCLHLGFDLFQGEFFAKPSVVTKKSITPSQALLLELSSRMAKNEDIRAIEEMFKKNPDLTFGLLNLAHSAFFRIPESVTSVRQAITLLGYDNLQKWIGLMLFTIDHTDTGSNPLFERTLIRARIMELLAQRKTEDRTVSDSAFITGIFSLTPVLFGVPVEAMIEKTNLADDIREALLRRTGTLGTLLGATELVERGDYEACGPLLQDSGLFLIDLLSAETKAIIEYQSSTTSQGKTKAEAAVEARGPRSEPTLATARAPKPGEKNGTTWLSRIKTLFFGPQKSTPLHP